MSSVFCIRIYMFLSYICMYHHYSVSFVLFNFNTFSFILVLQNNFHIPLYKIKCEKQILPSCFPREKQILIYISLGVVRSLPWGPRGLAVRRVTPASGVRYSTREFHSGAPGVPLSSSTRYPGAPLPLCSYVNRGLLVVDRTLCACPVTCKLSSRHLTSHLLTRL